MLFPGGYDSASGMRRGARAIGRRGEAPNLRRLNGWGSWTTSKLWDEATGQKHRKPRASIMGNRINRARIMASATETGLPRRSGSQGRIPKTLLTIRPLRFPGRQVSGEAMLIRRSGGRFRFIPVYSASTTACISPLSVAAASALSVASSLSAAAVLATTVMPRRTFSSGVKSIYA